jgi:ADP-ribosylglycohydrolase
MPRIQRTPEQQLAHLQQQELKLKARRKAAEDKLRRQRDREMERNLADLVQILKRHGISKLTPERLQKALATIQ